MRAARHPLISLLAVAAVAGAWTLGSWEGSLYVCRKTGMIRSVTSRGPFTTERIEETELSRTLAEGGHRKWAEHDWLYAHGRGRRLLYGRFSASGDALGMLSYVRSPELATAVGLLIAHADRPTIDMWLARRASDQVRSL